MQGHISSYSPFELMCRVALISESIEVSSLERERERERERKKKKEKEKKKKRMRDAISTERCPNQFRVQFNSLQV